MPLPILLIGAAVSGSVALAAGRSRRRRIDDDDASHDEPGCAIYPTAARLQQALGRLRAELRGLGALRRQIWLETLPRFQALLGQLRNLSDDLTPVPDHDDTASDLREGVIGAVGLQEAGESETLRWMLGELPELTEPRRVLGGLLLSPASQAVIADPRLGGGDIEEVTAARVIVVGLLRLAEAWRAELQQLDAAFQVALVDLSMLVEQETDYRRLSEHPLPGAWMGARALVQLSHRCAMLLHALAAHSLIDPDGRPSPAAPRLLDDCSALRRSALRGLEEALFAARLQGTPRAGLLIG